MNALVKKLEKSFEPNISAQELDKRTNDYLKKYHQLKEKNEKRFISRLTFEQRRSIHGALIKMVSLMNRLSGLTYEIIHDRRVNTSSPIIFAPTHIGFYDIQIVLEAIKDHAYLLTNAFDYLQGTFDNIALSLNGVFYFNSTIKEERKVVSGKMINHLQNGGNILYFPEGEWNYSPNLLILPLYWGIIDVARKGNAMIVPIAVNQYGKHFKINIGELFDVRQYDNSDIGKADAIADLREIMASLKYEIFETQNISRGRDIPHDFWNTFLLERFAEMPMIKLQTAREFAKSDERFSDVQSAFIKYNLECIERNIFKPKAIISREKAFSHLNDITPSLNCAFLFSKRNHF
ncbi:MAG: lysophospholipid acyltransferase family protein [Oscillospiraceae bacterium]